MSKLQFFYIIFAVYYIAVDVTWYRVRDSKSTGIPNFIHIGPPAAKIWRLIHFQDGSRGCAVLLPVSHLITLHSSKAKIYLQTKFRRYISTNDWDIAISVFGKQTSLELIPGCDFNHIAVIGMSFCTRVPNLIQIAPPAANMTSYRFLKMAAAAAQYYFWFPNCWYHFFRNKTLTTTRSQFVLTNHVRQPSIRIYKGFKSDQHIQILTKLALNWISGILRKKSYIANELKTNWLGWRFGLVVTRWLRST